MGLFKGKKKDKVYYSKDDAFGSKTLPEQRSQLVNMKLDRELSRLANSGLSPFEIAKKMSQLRSLYESELELTVEEVRRKRAKEAGDLLASLNDEELRELFTEFFVNSRVQAAKDDGMNDLDVESLRLSSEAYVEKLMAMSAGERAAEFRRIDDEKVRNAESSNFEQIMERCIIREADELRKRGYDDETIASIQEKRDVEALIGIAYSPEEIESARLELEYSDLTQGTHYIIDIDDLQTVERSLFMTKADIELRKLMATRKK